MTEVQKAFSYHFIFQKSMLRLHRKIKHGRIGEGLLISLYFPEINTDTSSLFLEREFKGNWVNCWCIEVGDHCVSLKYKPLDPSFYRS